VGAPGCGYGGGRDVLPAGVVAPFSGTARDSGDPSDDDDDDDDGNRDGERNTLARTLGIPKSA
jgi:hypothetical protein